MLAPALAGKVPTDVDDPTIRGAVIPSLDGLRAISIALVLAGHAVPGGSRPFFVRVCMDHANLGVRVFFVISGFLITSLLLRERARSGNISLRRFYIRRALRILPAFFLFIGCVALLSLFGVIPVPAWMWLYVLTYTVNFAPFPPFSWALIHIWSLSVEEQFYLLWPMVIKKASPRACTAVAILAIFASPVTHALQALGHFAMPGYGPFPLVCCPIALGSLLAMRATNVRKLIVSSKLLSDSRTLLFMLFLIALLDVITNRPGTITDIGQIFQNFLLTLCVARLVFLPGGLAGRALNSAPFVVIGKISYSLYLWQQLFLYKLSGKGVFGLALAFGLIFASASASYWGLEIRFLGLRKKFRTAAESTTSLINT